MRLAREQTALRTASLTAAALVAFAANSLLCRLALRAAQIDAASYTSLRLLSGAATLWVILAFSGRSSSTKEGSTGAGFFAALVLNLAEALGTHCAWVTELAGETRQLRAPAYWAGGQWI